jgi:[ribosomal protein S18]-alanine N-acetyltransferase
MIHIRNAHAGEADVLTSIGLRAWQMAMTSIGGTNALLDGANSAFAHFAEQSWLTITVIEQNGEAVGWAARETLDETISDFWIDPDHLRQGLGTALLARIEQDIREQGLEKAMLQTHSDNEQALHFFKTHGYAIHWLSTVYSPKLDRDVPTVGLSKSLVAPDVDGFGYGAV